MTLPDKFNTLIVTLSDRAHAGEYKDLSGPEIKSLLDEYFTSINWHLESEVVVIPDDIAMLRQLINESSQTYNIIITTGGTGIGPRDFTVDVVQDLLDFEIPGIMEHIRVKYGMEKPNALLSRGVAGVKDKSLIYTLPGSVKAVKEYMTEILKTLQHAIYMQYGIDVHTRH
jgi:molybdopterin adenylyltransferase